jgi:hypothetical protein
MPVSIYRSLEGQAELLGLYDEALSHLRAGHESNTISTRCGETHVLLLGPEDAPPVVFLHGGNFLNPACLRWFLPHRPATPHTLPRYRGTTGHEREA